VHGPQVGVCRVCGELTDTYSNATCMQCGFPFHLALRRDVPAKDCGQVWIDDETQTLDFACDVCLGKVELSPAVEKEGTPRPAYARSEGMRASDILRRKRAGRRKREA
jgi:ribosomal protein L37E